MPKTYEPDVLEEGTDSQTAPSSADADVDEVLVIEDHVGTAQALGRILSKAGYRARVFFHAERARQWLEAGAGGRPLTAAVIDVHLADGDGAELANLLRSRMGPESPVIAVSGDTSMETLQRLGSAGVSRFIGKPVAAEAVLAAIEGRE